jgi:hypothetical protein
VIGDSLTKTLLERNFASARSSLVSYLEQSGLAKNGSVVGTARELAIRNFLESSLPSLIEFKNGEIIDSHNNRSGQVDIILQTLSTVRIPLLNDTQIALADGVIAAMEIKSNLTWSDKSDSTLKHAINTICKIKNLNPDPVSSKYGQHTISKIPCFLVSYKGMLKDRLLEILEKYESDTTIKPEMFWPDIIIVLKLGYCIFRNNGMVIPCAAGQKKYFIVNDPDQCLIPLFMYISKLLSIWNPESRIADLNKYVKVDYI